jgi:hypothetical protein
MGDERDWKLKSKLKSGVVVSAGGRETRVEVLPFSSSLRALARGHTS